MRPKIMPSRSITRSIYYNEKKVTQYEAECLLAANFLKDTDKLTIDDKLLRFERRQQLNERVTTSLHITLNFDPADVLPNEKMQQIAKLYMDKLGFERQPYLVYRHYDAGHPHCHIVTTHIQRNGDPIDLYKLGENQSEKARLHLEEKFSLITAEEKRQTQRLTQKNQVKKITYGQRSTTSALSTAIQYVTENYRYTDLEEFNTILRLYNAEACPVKENAKHHQRHDARHHQGLLYRVLDEQGRYIGRPLKASFFDFKPTLANLEKRFAENHVQKETYKQYLTTSLLWELTKKDPELSQVENNLQRHGIQLIYRLDKEKQLTSLFYIDFEHKCIYNEKDLDPRCHKQHLQQLVDRHHTLHQHHVEKQQHKQHHHHRLRITD